MMIAKVSASSAPMPGGSACGFGSKLGDCQPILHYVALILEDQPAAGQPNIASQPTIARTGPNPKGSRVN
jgi:hypothetical protein